MSDAITIKSCATQAEAEFFKALLASHGVNAMIVADDYAGLPLMTSGGVQLQVLAEEVDQAQQVLATASHKD